MDGKALEAWPSLRVGVGTRVKVGAGAWWGNGERCQLSFCYCHKYPRRSPYRERRFIMANTFGDSSLETSGPIILGPVTKQCVRLVNMPEQKQSAPV